MSLDVLFVDVVALLLVGLVVWYFRLLRRS
jgi:hypothetical protein